jgi:6-phosphofructokinase
MTIRNYLAEHAIPVRLALDLARKEAEHLRYSFDTLYAFQLDETWVKDLADKPALAEKVEAFVSRFSRLQDHIGEKLLPRYAQLVGEQHKTQIDVLGFAERAGIVTNADEFLAARRLCNALVHEYMQDSQSFLESLLQARIAAQMLFDVVDRLEAELQRLGV